MWPPEKISNDNKFTLKPILVCLFASFFSNHTYIHHCNVDHILLFHCHFHRSAGWLRESPSAASEVQLAVHGAWCLLKLQRTQRWSLIPVIGLLPAIPAFFCYWQSQQMTNTQNTARHSTTESNTLHKNHRSPNKDIVWLNNYNALDVVDDDCYTSL